MAGAATLSLSVAAYASEFSRVIVFGDRYLDAGQYVSANTIFAEPDEELGDRRDRFTNRDETGGQAHNWGTLVSRTLGHGDTNPSQPSLQPGSDIVPETGLNFAAGFSSTFDILDSITGTSSTAGIRYTQGDETVDIFGSDRPGLLDDSTRGWAANSVVLMNGGSWDIRHLANIARDLSGNVQAYESLVVIEEEYREEIAVSAAENIATGAIALRDADAGLVVVANLFDVGAMPEIAGDITGAADGIAFLDEQLAIAQAADPLAVEDNYSAYLRAGFEAIIANPEIVSEFRTEGTDRFNESLSTLLDGQDNVVVIDQNALMAEVIRDPARFGLSADISQAEQCLDDAELYPCDAVSDAFIGDALFLNGVNLSETAQELFADQVSGVINAPVQVSGLPLSTIASGREIANAGRAQVTAERIARKGWAPFVSAGIGSSTWNELSGEGRHGSLRLNGTIGATYHLGNGFSVGAAAGYQDISGAMSETSIDVDGSAIYGTVFAGADVADVFGNASITFGSVDYDDVSRLTQIGEATIRNSGETDGSVFGASLEVGYRALKYDTVAAGPIASIDHWSTSIDRYDEGGWAATAVNYTSDLDNSSTRVSLGAFLEAGDLNFEDMPIVFRAKALYTRELDTDPITVTAQAQSSPNNSFSREGRGAQADSLTLGAQLVYDFGPVIGSLNYNVRVGEADDHSGSIDFSVPFGGK